MLLLRTFVVGLLAVAALATPGGAGAKGEPPIAVRICGPTACSSVVAVSNWDVPEWLLDQNARSGPAALAPFYSLGLVFSAGSTSPLAYYVPSAGLIKLKGSIPGLGEAIWIHVSADVVGLLQRASEDIRPFARPRVRWAMVGNRWVKRPGSYLRLYGLDGRPAADPAAPAPSLQYQTSDREAWFAAWSPYLDRVRREWIRVQIGTSRPTAPGLTWRASSGSGAASTS